MAKIKVGIVEDEMIIAQGIAKTLKELGYAPAGPAVSYTAALEMIERERPDILLLDIVLSGHKDGIDLAWKVKEDYNIPFIFLTANSDAATVERAKKVCPPAYLVKPFNKDELYTAIEICLYNYAAAARGIATFGKENYLVKDCLFIKQGSNYIKVRLADVIYLESDRVYISVYTRSATYLVRSTIQNYLDLIASPGFVRVHRSYAVNTANLDAIGAETVTVNGRQLPIGKAYRDELLQALRLG